MTQTTTPAPTASTSPTETILTTRKPVIFLDCDGILILPGGEWCPQAMQELNRLCLETGAVVVLTTSFRYSGRVKALHDMLLKNGFDKGTPVLGETRDLSAYRGGKAGRFCVLGRVRAVEQRAGDSGVAGRAFGRHALHRDRRPI